MAIKACALVCLMALCAVVRAGNDPLDTAARSSPLAAQRPITALAHAGDAVVAVGQRGHVLRSADAGKSWTQARVPVSSDLTAVQFVDARTGYATGHDGVVLKSEDGGATWTRILDGRTANRLLVEQLKAKGAGAEAERKLLQDAERNAELGPDKPFLDLWFSSATDGFVVGAYNLILHTADGGKTWQPWFDRTDNPRQLSLYSIRPAAGALFIAGEAGLLLKLDPAAQRFRALTSDYTGSWFGLLGTGSRVIAFGMRGHAYRSDDAGAHWQPMATGLAASITGGDAQPQGQVLLVDLAGNIVMSRDGGDSFAAVPLGAPMPLAAVLRQGAGLVLAGPRGLRRIELNKDQ